MALADQTALQVTWQWQRFANEARADNLQLEHWAKCYKDSAGNLRPDYEGPYRWAKLDVKVRTWLQTSLRLWHC